MKKWIEWVEGVYCESTFWGTIALCKSVTCTTRSCYKYQNNRVQWKQRRAFPKSKYPLNSNVKHHKYSRNKEGAKEAAAEWKPWRPWPASAWDNFGLSSETTFGFSYEAIVNFDFWGEIMFSVDTFFYVLFFVKRDSLVMSQFGVFQFSLPLESPWDNLQFWSPNRWW